MAWLDSLKDSLDITSDMALADRAGISSPSVVNGWRNRRVQPDQGNLRKLAQLAGEPPIRVFALAGRIDAEDLEQPGGPLAEPLPQALQQLIKVYRAADTDTRAVVLSQIQFILRALDR